MSLDSLSRTAYTSDHEIFRQTVRQFVTREIEPNTAAWDEAGIVPKSIWPKAGALGMLCPTVPEAYGGLGLDFGYNAIVNQRGFDLAEGLAFLIGNGEGAELPVNMRRHLRDACLADARRRLGPVYAVIVPH